ncbi:MAG: FtsX-like permease family protein [Cyclobacteriaceae bacterium]
MKRKIFVLINILGMGLAVALCIVAYLNWDFRKNWDRSQKNKESIYRIQFLRDGQDEIEKYGMAPMPLANHIDKNIVDVATKYISRESDIKIEDELFRTLLSYADSQFFAMFDIELKFGDIRNFKDKSTIFISDELAKKYFNKENVIGESITQVKNGVPKEFIVGGVFKKWPLNSSFDFDAIALWENLWDSETDVDLKDTDWKTWNTTFVQVRDPNKIAEITKQLQQYVHQQNEARQDFKIKEFYLEPFEGIQEFRVRNNALRIGVPDVAVTIPSIMAVMLLLLACFNFTNTSIALSEKRLKEIGIRKVMGGHRKQLVIQFLGENLFLCSLSFAFGLFLAEFIVPAYSSLWFWLDLDLSYTDNAGMLLFLFCLLIITGLLAGGYPAFYVTSFEPINILKGKTQLGGSNWLSRSLLAAQFSISLVTIVFAVAFYHNAQYQKNYDLGFLTTGVISVHVKNEDAFNAYKDALTSCSDIVKVAGTKDHISNSFYTSTVRYESIEKEVDVMDIGDEYMDAMGMRIIAGRGFNIDSETDRNESIIVSEEFVREYGWREDPIGKRIMLRDTIPLYIIGVAKDLYARSLWLPLEPMILRYAQHEKYSQLIAKIAPGKMAEANLFMKKAWGKLFPNLLYEELFIDNELKVTNDTNKNVLIIFGCLGIFAALMSGTGLFTLVSLTIMKRIKEIGIRKVLGASIQNIVGVISYEFILILLFASLLGGIVGFKMVDVSMDAAWEYYEKVSLLTLVTSVMIMFLLAVLTVGFKTIRAARMNPTKNLRSE